MPRLRLSAPLPPRSVSDPAGIAADGLHIFWGNGAAGTSVGAIVEGARDVPKPAASTDGWKHVKPVGWVWGVNARFSGRSG